MVNMVGIIKEDDDDFGDVPYAPIGPVVDDLPSAKIALVISPATAGRFITIA